MRLIWSRFGRFGVGRQLEELFIIVEMVDTYNTSIQWSKQDDIPPGGVVSGAE
jgi:hypothetical protein